jgi:hypothetical protein
MRKLVDTNYSGWLFQFFHWVYEPHGHKPEGTFVLDCVALPKLVIALNSNHAMELHLRFLQRIKAYALCRFDLILVKRTVRQALAFDTL